MQPEEFEAELTRRAALASHGELKRWSALINQAKNERFPSDRRAKNELVEHGLTHEEFSRFMSVIEDQEDRAIFTLVAVLGLRPNELVRLRGRNVQGERLIIPASKVGHEADLRLPAQLLALIPAREPGEQLFRTTTAMLAKRFREYRELAGMNEVYGFSKECGRAKVERPLYRVSLKSLRYTGAQHVAAMTNGNILLSNKLLRHRKLETTMRYMRKHLRPELEAALEASAHVLAAPHDFPPLKSPRKNVEVGF